ncbi:MAG: hypothetical protein MUP85_21035 [Candidatus Lokiarchaeota archaeon]|nr:hypothetical protein [Candidatus Lokiarchaeota archaeon]
MKAIGLVFLYDRNEGSPQEVSTNFITHFSNVTENLIFAGLMELPELKEIMDTKRIYWGGIKQNFAEILREEETIGKLAWKLFSDNSGITPHEEVKSLIYEKENSPWNFTIMVCVLYQ